MTVVKYAVLFLIMAPAIILISSDMPDSAPCTIVCYIATDGSGDFNTDGTDDQIEIQEAIDAAESHVIFKRGEYRVNEEVTIYNRSGLKISGDASDMSGVKIYANSSVFRVNQSRNITIEYMSLYDTEGGNVGITFDTHVSHSKIDHIYASRFQKGMRFRSNVSYSGISNSVLVGGAQMFLGGPGILANTHNTLDSNSVTGGTQAYSLNSNNKYTLIKNNYAADATNFCYDSYATAHNVYENNVAERCKWGFRLSGGGDNLFHGNIVRDSTDAGFIIFDNYGPNNTTIRNNMVINSRNHDIYVANDAGKRAAILVINNSFSGAGGDCISNTKSPSITFVAMNNTCANNSGAGINTPLGPTKSSYNIFFNNKGGAYRGTVTDKTGDAAGA